MQKILILGAGEMQVPIIQKSKSLGFYTIVVDFDENALGFEYADKKYFESTMDSAKVLQIAIENKIDGILSTSDLPVNVVSYVSENLNLRSMTMKVAEICTNKFLQRSFFSDKGVRMPGYKLVEDVSELDQFNVFPLIIKPIDSSASRGVKKVNNGEELKIQFFKSLDYSKQKKAIVEDYIEGREFSIETITQDNITHIIAITEKLTKGSEQGVFVEDTHIIPARITAEEREQIINEVQKAITLLGLNNCPSHTEVKLNNDGVFIIEIACRLGGDYITSDLIPLHNGVDMLENLINLSIGVNININEQYHKFSAIQFINVNNYKKAEGFIKLKQSKIIKHQLKKFEDKFIENSMDRLGHIIFQTDSEKELNELINEINS